MTGQQRNGLIPALCGGGAFLLLLDQFFEGVVAYLFSAVGIVMVIAGLILFVKGQRQKAAGP